MTKYGNSIQDEKMVDPNIPTGFPLVYELDESLKQIVQDCLCGEEEIERTTKSTGKQTDPAFSGGQ